MERLTKPTLWAVLTLLAFGTTIAIVYSYTTRYERNPCDVASKRTFVDAGSTEHPTVVAVVPDGRVEGQPVGFGVPICVVVAHLPPEPQRGGLTLVLGGQRMMKIVGRVVDQARGLVLFTLDRDAADRPAWQRVIGYPDISGKIPMAVSVSADQGGEYERVRDKSEMTFTLFEPAAMAAGLVALLFAVAMLFTLGRSTAILRDGGVTSPFSLARCQMAWWLYLITAAFLYIWFVTGQYNGVMTGSALVLLGISATTGLAAVTIDATAPGGASQGKSRSFLEDVLYEADSPTIHRLQIFVWTIILGIVLLWEVYARFGFPDFDTNLLVMMGISGGFYLGFKAKER